MEILTMLFGKAISAIVGKWIEYMRQRALERKAKRADDLHRYLDATREADKTEKEILAITAKMNKARLEELSAKQKLDKIREFNNRLKDV